MLNIFIIISALFRIATLEGNEALLWLSQTTISLGIFNFIALIIYNITMSIEGKD